MLCREFEAARIRSQHEHDRDVRLAWYSEALARTKRLPKLAGLLSRTRAPEFTGRTQTSEQMRAAVLVIAGQFGLRVTRGKERIH